MLRPELRDRRPVLVSLVLALLPAIIIAANLRFWAGVILLVFFLILFALELQPAHRFSPSRSLSRAQAGVIWALFFTFLLVLQFRFTGDGAVLVGFVPLAFYSLWLLRRIQKEGWGKPGKKEPNS
jgi:hypothetical protein